MNAKLEQLKDLLGEIYDLNRAQAVLGWDQQVNMPVKGAEDRGDQLATLARLAHQRATSEELGRLLDELRGLDAAPDSLEARLVKVARRDYEKHTRVSAAWVSEFARATTVAQSAWEKAKANNEFGVFRPHLEKILELNRQYAGFFAPYTHVYDPLLDIYEPGLKTAEVQAIFATLRTQQVKLIQAIREKPEVDDRLLFQAFDEQAQWDFGVEVIQRFGYDFERGRQDRSVHPFTTSFGLDDVRITTRFDPKFLNPALFGTMHECGHALYELGISHSLRRTPLADGASMAVHESQSRMWENLVGRSKAFWVFFYPRLQRAFPAQFGDVSLDTFYRAINKVAPSLIRVEADEATYNLHIMLRLELEIAMLEGSLAVKDLPEAWNQRMRDYLGITPPNDSLGVLQDVHWSGGMMGYFPTYALGNLVSVQIWEKIQQDIPDLEEQMMRGEFAALLGWLREHVHQYGAMFEPQELIQKVTGSKIDPQPYLRYLQGKFGELYGL
ncbi:carboxypeptidase M32 [Levilinea saccharolytica]|uniref:Metal-dependent carboxypeptidase n=1 Tax=Levilinea saccharolytica TaxID=229921 RepID=A0A0P6XVC9_9CHLR|nr:carboxypeptidase M32 [Levilinea saccharolytica]KPL77414.1 carboxypeptidase [Levilinea saccharolytica]GAP18769.1 Zn-dependent carboxypeptidase [Levilinea saccharolytica]